MVSNVPGHGTKGLGYSFLQMTDTPTDGTAEKQSQASQPNLWVRYRILQQYEEPQWKNLIVHSLLCILTYPVLFVSVVLASGRSLFWARFIVGAGCGITGALLGMSLGQLVRPHLEAAGTFPPHPPEVKHWVKWLLVWATVIHQSKYENNPGIQLKDLAPHADNPMSVWATCLILWKRFMFPGTTRKYRVAYEYVVDYYLQAFLAVLIQFL